MSRLQISFTTSTDLQQANRYLPPKFVPNELVGAFNALTSCVRFPSTRRVQVVHAQSAAPLLQPPRRFEADLDFTARLSLLCRLICVFLPPLTFWLIAAIFQGTVKPDTVLQRLLKPLWYDTGDSWMRLTWTLVKLTGLLIGSVAASILLRYQLRERQFTQHQHPRDELADVDSLFKTVCGISVHCKKACPTQPQQPTLGNTEEGGGFFRMFSRRRSSGASAEHAPSPPTNDVAATGVAAAIALYHGFGANLWSWMRVQQQLADETGATVLAHDMPGFGLTERASTASAYTLQRNGDIGRSLAADALSTGGATAVASPAIGSMPGTSGGSISDTTSTQHASRPPVVLVGHSLGAAGVASSFVHNPEGVDGVVLVAPAIMVSPFSVSPKLRSRKIISDDTCHRLLEEYDLQTGNGGPREVGDMPVTEQSWHARSLVGAALQGMKRLLVPLLFWVIRPAMFVVLRGLVRMKSFWERGLKSCYFDTAKLSDEMVYYYRLPQLMKGWEMGILRFLQARFMANEHWKTVEAAQKPRSSAHSGTEYVTKGNSLLARFEQAVKDTGIPVLIIHGEQDTLVPIGNSCRLAAVIHAPLIKISGCGHTPAEELPEMFVEEVSRFMKENILTEVAPDRRKRRPAK